MRTLLFLTALLIFSSCRDNNDLTVCFIDVDSFGAFDSTESCGIVIKEKQKFIYVSTDNQEDTLRVLNIDSLFFGDTYWTVVDSSQLDLNKLLDRCYFAIPNENLVNTMEERTPVLAFNNKIGLIGFCYLDGSIVIKERLLKDKFFLKKKVIKKIKTIANNT